MLVTRSRVVHTRVWMAGVEGEVDSWSAGCDVGRGRSHRRLRSVLDDRILSRWGSVHPLAVVAACPS